MKVGEYQIGRYHAIIKKIYEDGTYDYETSFSSEADLMESVIALRHCVGQVIGLATKTPQKLVDMTVIRGKEAITKELEAESR